MSHLFIDKKYLGFISNRLRNVQYKGTRGAIMSFSHSCERSDSRKQRGYFLEYKQSLIFKCHHCGQSMSFGKFLEEQDQTLAKEYRIELFKEGVFGDYKPPVTEERKPVQPTLDPEEEDVPDFFSSLVNYTELKVNHPAIAYLEKRKIPLERYNRFYFCADFYQWASLIDERFKQFKTKVPRLVIPYWGKNKELLGFVCRAFGKEVPKYIQLRLDKDNEFIYGLDEIDEQRSIIAVEGQIDSLFLDNSIAVGNASYSSDYLRSIKDRVIIVPDNDFRRNLLVCNQLKKAINAGFSVSILPDRWKKDINAIVQSGIDAKTVMETIYANAKSGPAAILELTLEKKC